MATRGTDLRAHILRFNHPYRHIQRLQVEVPAILSQHPVDAGIVGPHGEVRYPAPLAYQTGAFALSLVVQPLAEVLPRQFRFIPRNVISLNYVTDDDNQGCIRS